MKPEISALLAQLERENGMNAQDILKWTKIALVGVSVAEETASSEDTGATKKQTALDIINNELQLVGQVAPAQGALIQASLSTIINAIVLVNNAKGIFAHKTTAAA
jgi:hypothetical protein